MKNKVNSNLSFDIFAKEENMKKNNNIKTNNNITEDNIENDNKFDTKNNENLDVEKLENADKINDLNEIHNKIESAELASNSNRKFKIFIISLFVAFISIVPIIMSLTEDKSVNEMENKVLQKFPRLNYQNIKNGRFMTNFNTYVSDQFPNRNLFLYTKNGFNYLIGQREFRNIYLTKNGRLLEKYEQDLDTINSNIDFVNNIISKSNKKSNLFLVPNSISIYKELLPNFAITESQEESLEYIKTRINCDLYSPLKILLKHKDEYIFFNTDHHWTQLGAKLAFEDYYNEKINNLDLNLVSSGFLGTYYSKAMINSIKSDTIFSYENLGDFENTFDGETRNSLYNNEKLIGKNKYQYFLNGDPAYGIINGTGEGEILILKDSFAHNFLPFMAGKYEKIHVIDPRYYNKDITAYIEENDNIEEILFLFSVATFNDINLNH